MAINQSDDIGRFARHPLRTMGAAFLVGSTMGAGMMAAKKHREKTPAQKFLDRLNSGMQMR
jgi:hypothetical protein